MGVVTATRAYVEDRRVVVNVSESADGISASTVKSRLSVSKELTGVRVVEVADKVVIKD